MATDTVHSIQGDTVDAICHRYYGRTSKTVESVYQANPGLAEHGPILPAGTAVVMPVVEEKSTAETVKLWD